MQPLERFLLMAAALAAASGWLAAGALARPALAPEPVPAAAWIVGAAGCGGAGMPGGIYRAYVKGVQEELTRHGYDAGPPDGTLGARTETAIRRYQRDAGLAVDGCASRELLDHLKFHLPKVYARGTAPQAAIGLAVQQELARRGYYLGAVDGKVGPRTQSAVRGFQKDAGLTVNGVVDQGLLDRLKTADPSIRAHR